jgi:polar amino acid transport system permease protein
VSTGGACTPERKADLALGPSDRELRAERWPLNYTFQFGTVVDRFPELLTGAALTIRLSALAMLFGLMIGTACSIGKVYGPKPLQWLVNVYVEFIRNTPFLIQLYFVFFALPHFGVRMNSNTAALLAMVINLGAYSTEIVRAGVEAIPGGQIEAGRALGLKRFHIVRFIVLFPALKAVYPALTSQFILVLLGSSVVSAIAAEELTAIANNINSQTFRSFEIYTIVTVMYVAIVFGFRALFTSVYALTFARRG